MPYGPPRPDLNAPQGLDPGTQDYLQQARGINPHISEAQFMHPEWRNAYDPQGCPPNKPFHSIKQGGDNSCVEQPDNCPDGKTAFGANECISGDDPRVGGGRGAQAPPGQGGQGASPQGGPGGMAYTGNPLVDALLYQFNSRRSLQTGAPNIFTGFAHEGQDFPNISGQLLKGGGLLWGAPGSLGQQGSPDVGAPKPPRLGGGGGGGTISTPGVLQPGGASPFSQGGLQPGPLDQVPFQRKVPYQTWRASNPMNTMFPTTGGSGLGAALAGRF